MLSKQPQPAQSDESTAGPPRASAAPKPSPVALARQPAWTQQAGGPLPVSRPDDALEHAAEQAATAATLQARSTAVAAEGPAVAPPIVHQVLSSPGRPLPTGVQASMEERLAVDLAAVRVHDDAQAHASAEAVSAQAYTVGTDIVFGSGRFAPHTGEGQHLLAHELAHVMQQSRPAQVQRTPKEQAALEKKYRIKIESGDKAWSDGEIKDLEWALSKLSANEATGLRDYRFIRWSTTDARAEKDPTYSREGSEECGLHEAELESGMFKISMYDACFAESTTMAGVPIGQFHILHEIGHAMEVVELRKAWEAYNAANDKFNAAVAKFNQASPAEQEKTKKSVEALGEAEAAAKAAMEAATGRSLKDFAAKTADKPALTDYSKTGSMEAFAEAFALFKANPEGLKKSNPDLYDWFVQEAHLAPPPPKKKKAKKK